MILEVFLEWQGLTKVIAQCFPGSPQVQGPGVHPQHLK